MWRELRKRLVNYNNYIIRKNTIISSVVLIHATDNHSILANINLIINVVTNKTMKKLDKHTH